MYLAASSPPRVPGFRPSSGVVGEKLEMRADDIGVHGTGHTAGWRAGGRLLRTGYPSEQRESKNGEGDTHGVPRAET